MNKQLYLRVQQLLNDAQIGMRHYDWFNHQYGRKINSTYANRQERQRESLELPFLRPAVLFEWQKASFSKTGIKEQLANVEFNLHIISDFKGESRLGSSSQGASLSHLDFAEDVYATLQGYTDNDFSSFSRLNDTYDHRQDQLIIHISRFRTSYIDRSANSTSSGPNLNPTPIINPRIIGVE